MPGGRLGASRDGEDPMTNLHDRTARRREAVVPGRLAEAMPDWLTAAVRPKPAPVPLGAMVRAALATCVPLSVGIVAGRRDIWLLLAIGGLTGTVIDTGGPYMVRVKRAVIAGAFGGAAGLVIGMLIHNRGWIAVASLVVVAGVSALSPGWAAPHRPPGCNCWSSPRWAWARSAHYGPGGTSCWASPQASPGRCCSSYRAGCCPPGPRNRAPSPTSTTRSPTTCARSAPTAPPRPGARSRSRSTPRTTPCSPRGRQPTAEAGA